MNSSSITALALKEAQVILIRHKLIKHLLSRIDAFAESWDVTPMWFMEQLAPLNCLVTLARFEPDQYNELVKYVLTKHAEYEKPSVTAKRKYMRDFMRKKRAEIRAARLADAGLIVDAAVPEPPTIESQEKPSTRPKAKATSRKSSTT